MNRRMVSYVSSIIGLIVILVSLLYLIGVDSLVYNISSKTDYKRKPNISPAYKINQKIEPIIFSHVGGWYEEEFLLQLSSSFKNAEIYYTTDGTEPTENSIKYEEPIRITAKSGIPSYHPTKKDIFMGTVIRAIVVMPDGRKSETYSHTYFVHPQGSSRYKMPVISITINPEDFFDHRAGIYVRGRMINYTWRGRRAEKEGYIEFFETDGKLAFSQNVGFRIHGNYSREHEQRSLRIYARNEYDTKNKISYEIFPGLKDAYGNPLVEFKRLILRNSGNDWFHTMFRDSLMHSIVAHTRVDTQAARPAIVFINGEYWGIYNIREKYDQHYFYYKYGISEDVVILELNGKLNHGNPGDENHYNEMISYLKNNDISDPIHYNYIKTQMDVDNFIDYSIAQIYFSNTDYPGNNIKFWRVNTDEYIEEAGFKDGRWRWLLYDTDFGFNLANSYYHNTLRFATEEGNKDWPNPDWATFLLRTLLKNQEFRNAFINRFADLLNTAFSSERVLDLIEEYETIYSYEIDEHINRWNAIGNWPAEVNKLKEFAENRPGRVYNHIRSFFNISSINTLELHTDLNMGYIGVNSLDIAENTIGIRSPVYPWKGKYFSDVPITLTAYPKEGYRFVRWDGIDRGSDMPQITFELNADMKVTAIFEKVERS